jgi:hypothetical protein
MDYVIIDARTGRKLYAITWERSAGERQILWWRLALTKSTFVENAQYLRLVPKQQVD